jgi:hypothetical protein
MQNYKKVALLLWIIPYFALLIGKVVLLFRPPQWFFWGCVMAIGVWAISGTLLLMHYKKCRLGALLAFYASVLIMLGELLSDLHSYRLNSLFVIIDYFAFLTIIAGAIIELLRLVKIPKESEVENDHGA